MASGVTEAWIRFETAAGRGHGHVRLQGDLAWTLLTTIYELKGHEEPQRERRPKGVVHGADPNRRTWAEERQREAEELGITTQPYVVIVGGGQGGIALGARPRARPAPQTARPRHRHVGQAEPPALRGHGRLPRRPAPLLGAPRPRRLPRQEGRRHRLQQLRARHLRRALAQGGARPTLTAAAPPASFAYDAFLVYSPDERDSAWARSLFRLLEERGVRVCTEERDAELGSYRLLEIERLVSTSRFTLPVLTPRFTTGPFQELQTVLAQHLGIEDGRARLIAIVREPCDARLGLQTLMSLT